MADSGKPSEILVRVEAKHFVAGLIMEGDVCVHAAPILKKSIGKRRDELRALFKRMGWKATVLK